MDKTNGQLTSLGSTSPAAAFALFRQDPSDEYSAELRKVRRRMKKAGDALRAQSMNHSETHFSGSVLCFCPNLKD